MNAFGGYTLLLSLALSLSATETGMEGSFDKSLSVSGPVDLDVKTDSGGITIRQGSSGSVKIHAILKGSHGWLSSGDVEARIQELERHPPVEQNGSQIRVGYVLGRDLLRDISMRLEIETPANTKVRARADSGGIKIEGVQGPVDCKADSGGLEITDASEVRAVADSGGIHIRNVAGPVFAHADSGGIEALEIAGSINAQSDSGRLQLSQTKPAPITVRAESGGVTVTLVPSAGYDVRAETDSGRISIPEMTVHSAFSSHHVEGSVRGGGPLVKIHADSGSITIE